MEPIIEMHLIKLKEFSAWKVIPIGCAQGLLGQQVRLQLMRAYNWVQEIDFASENNNNLWVDFQFIYIKINNDKQYKVMLTYKLIYLN